jgi:hypothetical protein
MLEDIAKTYGMIDYYEQQTGNIYHLSEAKSNGHGMLLVPVTRGDRLFGVMKMKDITNNKNDKL